MKLYTIPRNSYVKLEDGEIVFFGHIDGMYSYCVVPEGVTLLGASTEVEMSSKEAYDNYWKD